MSGRFSHNRQRWSTGCLPATRRKPLRIRQDSPFVAEFAEGIRASPASRGTSVPLVILTRRTWISSPGGLTSPRSPALFRGTLTMILRQCRREMIIHSQEDSLCVTPAGWFGRF